MEMAALCASFAARFPSQSLGHSIKSRARYLRRSCSVHSRDVVTGQSTHKRDGWGNRRRMVKRYISGRSAFFYATDVCWRRWAGHLAWFAGKELNLGWKYICTGMIGESRGRLVKWILQKWVMQIRITLKCLRMRWNRSFSDDGCGSRILWRQV
jgi:hypothetical protein